ncbi:hypothetical protein BT96DRAFT_947803 [Gymnopus androsaceus JB14]|uniref:Uncharacterized protein n=1 Tax=Gymnopus androsaceus JB14 TaxID=1447944 RepID=A0A6A4GS87_9AGAR|nr:hypothetical protein BT96DRAFT_947803 [Gymnopus androsaceus JB14]
MSFKALETWKCGQRISKRIRHEFWPGFVSSAVFSISSQPTRLFISFDTHINRPTMVITESTSVTAANKKRASQPIPRPSLHIRPHQSCAHLNPDIHNSSSSDIFQGMLIDRTFFGIVIVDGRCWRDQQLERMVYMREFFLSVSTRILAATLIIESTLKDQGSIPSQRLTTPAFSMKFWMRCRKMGFSYFSSCVRYLVPHPTNTYMNDTSVTKQVNHIKSRPNLLLWYSADEPDGTSDPLNATSLAQSLITSLDGSDGNGGAGYHPVSLVEREDNDFPLQAEAQTRRDGTGETRKEQSWIWLTRKINLKDGADENENEILRAEWCKSRAQMHRAEEELRYLEVEMERSLRFLDWQAKWWDNRQVRPNPRKVPQLEEGIKAYATKQAEIQRGLRENFLISLGAFAAVVISLVKHLELVDISKLQAVRITAKADSISALVSKLEEASGPIIHMFPYELSAFGACKHTIAILETMFHKCVCPINPPNATEQAEPVTPDNKAFCYACFDIHPTNPQILVSILKDHVNDTPSTIVWDVEIPDRIKEEGEVEVEEDECFGFT